MLFLLIIKSNIVSKLFWLTNNVTAGEEDYNSTTSSRIGILGLDFVVAMATHRRTSLDLTSEDICRVVNGERHIITFILFELQLWF